MSSAGTRTRLSTSSPQPPSPIRTGKGSRSAANSVFADYVDNFKHIPDLTLPDYVHRSVPPEFDFRELLASASSGKGKAPAHSLDLLLRSISESGVFRITNHGISADELESTLEEAQWVFGSSLTSSFFRRNDNYNREGFSWCRSSMKTFEKAAKDVIGLEKYRIFSKKMESVTRKMEMIAEQLAQVICKDMTKQTQKIILSSESKLSISRYKQCATAGVPSQPLPANEVNQHSRQYALCLHLPLGQGKAHVQCERGPLSFDTTSETIIVTIGEQLQKWRHGEFKSACGVGHFEENLHGSQSQASFSLELKISPLNLGDDLSYRRKIIAISDQILIIILIALLYNFFANIPF